MDSSCITPTLPETTLVGKRPVSAPTTRSESFRSGSIASSALVLTGGRRNSAQSLLKQDYKDDMSLEDAKALALKIMSKTMDSTKLGSEKRELNYDRAPASTFK